MQEEIMFEFGLILGDQEFIVEIYLELKIHFIFR